MLNAEFRKILKKIKQYNIIVIARHISPDPDAIASQVSLRDAIKLTFPKKEVYAVGTSVSKFKYYGNLDVGNPSMILIKETLPASELEAIRLEVKYFDENNNELLK